LIVGCGLYVEDAEATVAAVRAAVGTMLSMQPCDLTQPGDCKALVDFAVRTFGRVEVLFNNRLSALQLARRHFRRGVDRNRRCEVDLVFYLTRAAWPYLKASRGVVVNTASLTALMSFKNRALAHTTAKAGIIGMTRQLAMEGRERGIRANSISPGVIETNQMREQLKDPEWDGYMLGKTPVGSPRPAGHSAHVLQHGIQICSRRLSPDAILP